VCGGERQGADDAEVALKTELARRSGRPPEELAVEEREERMRSKLEAPVNEPLSVRVRRRPQPEERKKDRFASFGEQLAASCGAGMPTGSVDPRLRNTRAATGLGETVPSDGGFLVQQDSATNCSAGVPDRRGSPPGAAGSDQQHQQQHQS